MKLAPEQYQTRDLLLWVQRATARPRQPANCTKVYLHSLRRYCDWGALLYNCTCCAGIAAALLNYWWKFSTFHGKAMILFCLFFSYILAFHSKSSNTLQESSNVQLFVTFGSGESRFTPTSRHAVQQESYNFCARATSFNIGSLSLLWLAFCVDTVSGRTAYAHCLY